jgi:hypothetical protein
MRHKTPPATNTRTIYRVAVFCEFAALLATGCVGIGGSETTSIGPIATPRIFDSHAADHLLAPPLQAGLQRFVKPWWKRRAFRIGGGLIHPFRGLRHCS